MDNPSRPPTDLTTSDFDYALPKSLIAQKPLEPRDASRLLVLNRSDQSLIHGHTFREIGDYLYPGDLLIFNDSRVLHCRLNGINNETKADVELLLVNRISEGIWRCLGKPSRRLRTGSILSFQKHSWDCNAEILDSLSHGFKIVRFDNEAVLPHIGTIPLPPYIRRPIEDPERYQTIYSKNLGSIAAPTAGLHFTDGLLDSLTNSGIKIAFTTLHVGPGTFRPVIVENPSEHYLEPEFFELKKSASDQINLTKQAGKRVICVGTTSMRTLEYAALQTPNSRGDAPVNSRVPSLNPMTGWADLMILPGHEFQIVDGLITNFHLPRSTLLMLVTAFGGNRFISHAYQEAISNQYRFYSFGDAMFIS